MTAGPRRHRDGEPGPADSPQRTSGPPPPEDDIAAGTANRIGRRNGGWLAYSIREAARLTGLSHGLLDDHTRLSNLACVMVGTWRLIICQHQQHFPGIAS